MALLLMGVAPVVATSAATAADWKIQPTPHPRGLSTGGLLGVSCTAAACTAVGSYSHSSGNGRTLAERWIKGKGWKVQSSPNPTRSTSAFLNGVSCPEASACKAVGGSEGDTLAERWIEGKGWKIQSTPNPNGSTRATLNGISCTAQDACIAVGSYVDRSGNEVTLAERWNGKAWTIESTPNPNGSTSASLRGVSCTAEACIAVGSSDTSGTLAERWNGTDWRIQPTPNPTQGLPVLEGVSCTGVNACTAVGSSDTSGTLAERWNGTEWRIQSTPKEEAGSRLAGVSCRASDVCTAVGDFRSSGKGLTLAERWDGTTWTIQSTPNPTGSFSAALLGVSCPAAGACTAAGNFEKTRTSGGVPLAERRG